MTETTCSNHSAVAIDIQRISERQDRFEEEIKAEIRQIKETIGQQNISYAKTEVTLESLVKKTDSFQSDFLKLLTASMQAQQKQTDALVLAQSKQADKWQDLIIKVLPWLLTLIATAWGMKDKIQ